MNIFLALLSTFAVLTSAVVQQPRTESSNPSISLQLYADLEELARLVDIAYCVGSTSLGIISPFQCLSRCSDFPAFELVTTFNTGPLLSDSCGYIALDHGRKRIVVAFRGTYSLVDTIVDLSTMPQEYVPFPGSGHDGDGDGKPLPCNNCTIHAGFYSSWQHTRSAILPYVQEQVSGHPDYRLHLVGHSLGGAVAALAGLDFFSRNWNPMVTTFGEPRLGNAALNRFLDARFGLVDKHGNGTAVSANSNGNDVDSLRYRRVTHINDPVPLLPPRNVLFGDYAPHAGEIFIDASILPPEMESVRHCNGDTDLECSFSQDGAEKPEHDQATTRADLRRDNLLASVQDELLEARAKEDPWWDGALPPQRYRLWQLLFAHREYFVKLGVCLPKGEAKVQHGQPGTPFAGPLPTALGEKLDL